MEAELAKVDGKKIENRVHPKHHSTQSDYKERVPMVVIPAKFGRYDEYLPNLASMTSMTYDEASMTSATSMTSMMRQV